MTQTKTNGILVNIAFVSYGQIIDKNNSKKYIFLILFMLSACYSSYSNIYSQKKYLIQDKEGFDFVLNVGVEGNTINGFTREKALLDYTSKFQFQLIKAASSLKHPEIIRFSATLTNGDFEGTYDYMFSSYKIIGNINTDSISYSLFNKSNELYKSFKGVKVINYKKKDYRNLAEVIIKTSEDNIFDPKITQSKKWSEYRKNMISAVSNASDDLEFQIGFFALTRKIGFSHYYILKNTASSNSKQESPSLKEIDKNTILLKISNFYKKKETVELLLDTVRQKAYKNLIIDLRDNTGGNFESALFLADFLTDKEIISGFFPNRKWYEEYNRQPNINDIDKFYLINQENTNQENPKYGFYIKTKGSENIFRGNTYFLVNKKTGSTAEALVIGAKEYSLAKIVGQKTSGGLLNAKKFNIDEDIILYVPVNDFISYKGYRVDQKGVEPDVKAKKGKELEQVIDMINKNH